MKKMREMKKSNNKGFSLVELIVVIAIMAVLVGVLAPQFLGYVERSRISTDIQNAQSVASEIAVNITEAETGATSTWTNPGPSWTEVTAADVQTVPEVRAVTGAKFYYRVVDKKTVHVAISTDATIDANEELYPVITHTTYLGSAPAAGGGTSTTPPTTP